MEKSKLHSSGKNDHLEVLKKEFIALRKKILGNDNMTDVEKKKEVKALTESFERKKQDTNTNLY